MPFRCLGVIAFAVCFAAPSAAEDWPEFRGPTQQGHYAGKLPRTWGPQKNVVWKQEIPGLGWSSPAIYQGRVYLTTSVPDEEKGYSLRALCLDARTGKIVWDQEVLHEDAESPRIHTKNSHASSSPLIADGKVYAHFGHMGSACLDLDGKIVWKNTDVQYAPVHGNGASPILVDGVLIFSCDGGDEAYVLGLDGRTGQSLWKNLRNTDAAKKFSFSTPLVIDVKGRKQVISPGSNAVCAYEPRTGKEIWRVHYEGYSVVPRPVFGGGVLFICTGYDSPKLLALRVDGKGDVTETHIAWQSQKNVPLTPSLLLVGDGLYMISDNGIATCLNARTGEQTWQERLPGKYSASPLYANGLIYVQNEDGLSTVFKAGQTFAPVARNDLEERSLASFAAADNALFIRTEKHLYRFEER